MTGDDTPKTTTGLDYLLDEAATLLPRETWGDSTYGIPTKAMVLSWAKRLLLGEWFDSSNAGALAAGILGLWKACRSGDFYLQPKVRSKPPNQLYLHLSAPPRQHGTEAPKIREDNHYWYWVIDSTFNLLLMGQVDIKESKTISHIIDLIRFRHQIESGIILYVFVDNNSIFYGNKNSNLHSYLFINFRKFYTYNKNDRKISLRSGKYSNISDELDYHVDSKREKHPLIIRIHEASRRERPLIQNARKMLDSRKWRDESEEIINWKEIIDFKQHDQDTGTWKQEYQNISAHLGKWIVEKHEKLSRLDDDLVALEIWQHLRIEELTHRISSELHGSLLAGREPLLRSPIFWLATVVLGLEVRMLGWARAAGASWPSEGAWKRLNKVSGKRTSGSTMIAWTVPKCFDGEPFKAILASADTTGAKSKS